MSRPRQGSAALGCPFDPWLQRGKRPRTSSPDQALTYDPANTAWARSANTPALYFGGLVAKRSTPSGLRSISTGSSASSMSRSKSSASSSGVATGTTGTGSYPGSGELISRGRGPPVGAVLQVQQQSPGSLLDVDVAVVECNGDDVSDPLLRAGDRRQKLEGCHRVPLVWALQHGPRAREKQMDVEDFRLVTLGQGFQPEGHWLSWFGARRPAGVVPPGWRGRRRTGRRGHCRCSRAGRCPSRAVRRPGGRRRARPRTGRGRGSGWSGVRVSRATACRSTWTCSISSCVRRTAPVGTAA